MSKTALAKGLIGRLAGDAMTGYFSGLFGAAGRAGKAATQGALNYGRTVMAPGATTSQIPKLLRAGANSPLPQLGYYGGQAALAGKVAFVLNDEKSLGGTIDITLRGDNLAAWIEESTWHEGRIEYPRSLSDDWSMHKDGEVSEWVDENSDR